MKTLTLMPALCLLAASATFGQSIALPLPLRGNSEEVKARAVGFAPNDKAKKKVMGPGCWLFPTLPSCVEAVQAKLQADPANKGMTIGYDDAVNAILGTSSTFTPFQQIQSIYNSASGSTTLSSDLGTLNFDSGMQVALVTNAQVGSSGTTSTAVGATPTLAATGAGQAVQNLLYGGTFLAQALIPVILAERGDPTATDGVIFNLDWVNRGGVDIQNFKANTNVATSNPPVHVSSKLEGYLQYNSTHMKSDPSGFKFTGAIFVGGSYGYDYMSHGYARDYGFGTNVSNGIGQASIGFLLNGVVKVAFSRSFGPSQTYIDSTSMVKTTVNNFKAWSLGISYQQAAAQSTAK